MKVNDATVSVACPYPVVDNALEYCLIGISGAASRVEPKEKTDTAVPTRDQLVGKRDTLLGVVESRGVRGGRCHRCCVEGFDKRHVGHSCRQSHHLARELIERYGGSGLPVDWLCRRQVNHIDLDPSVAVGASERIAPKGVVRVRSPCRVNTCRVSAIGDYTPLDSGCRR
jgi:hypothetical protein